MSQVPFKVESKDLPSPRDTSKQGSQALIWTKAVRKESEARVGFVDGDPFLDLSSELSNDDASTCQKSYPEIGNAGGAVTNSANLNDARRKPNLCSIAKRRVSSKVVTTSTLSARKVEVESKSKYLQKPSNVCIAFVVILYL